MGENNIDGGLAVTPESHDKNTGDMSIDFLKDFEKKTITAVMKT